MSAILLSPELESAVSRLIFFESKIKRLSEKDFWLTDEENEEYQALRELAKKEFIPLLEMLVDASLLGISIESPKYLKKKYQYVAFGIMDIYDNGSIYLEASHESHALSYRLDQNGNPNLGNNPTFEEYARETYIMAKGKKGKYPVWLTANESMIKDMYSHYLEMRKQEQYLELEQEQKDQDERNEHLGLN